MLVAIMIRLTGGDLCFMIQDCLKRAGTAKRRAYPAFWRRADCSFSSQTIVMSKMHQRERNVPQFIVERPDKFFKRIVDVSL